MKLDAHLFQTALLAWYDAHARSLPWREDPIPYKVWVSEIMLQQTRVDTVLPYFNRFIAALPNIKALAAVPEQELLKLWEGLGYYSRVRNMQKCAKMLVEQYGGELPRDPVQLQKLPGIGTYTAGAIASIAFNVKAQAVDGNVLRVFARIYAISEDVRQKAVQTKITQLVSGLQPDLRVGDFNQALMDLGATVCLPNGELKCELCPLKPFCGALKEGKTDRIPLLSKKSEREIQTKTVFVLVNNGRIALQKRPEKGLLAGLWELPNLDSVLDIKQCENYLAVQHIQYDKITPLPPAKHIFTHVEWHMTGYEVSAANVPDSTDLIWADKNEIKTKYTLPSAFNAYRKFIN